MRIRVSSIFLDDQAKALAFYTEKARNPFWPCSLWKTPSQTTWMWTSTRCLTTSLRSRTVQKDRARPSLPWRGGHPNTASSYAMNSVTWTYPKERKNGPEEVLDKSSRLLSRDRSALRVVIQEAVARG